MNLFDAFKQFIINHSKEVAYKPGSDKYDSDKLTAVLKELDFNNIIVSKDDVNKVKDFIEISDYFHAVMEDVYSYIKKDFDDFNMNGESIIQFFIAYLNREYKIIINKTHEQVKNHSKGTYLFQDMVNPKLQLPNGAYVDSRAALEGATDAINLICNYLRFFLKQDFKNEKASPERFAANVLRVFQIANVYVTFKHSYDDMLYNGGFVKIEREKKVFTFDYDNHYHLKLLRAGNMMFSERVFHVNNKFKAEKKTTVLSKYVSLYRINPNIQLKDGCVMLECIHGEAQLHHEIAVETAAAIVSFYDYLDLNMTLNKMRNVLLVEALAVLNALRYVCCEAFERLDCDVSMFTKEQMDCIPRLFKKSDLISIIEKLTGINSNIVKIVLEVFEVDWKHYNNIWTSPLIVVDDYYCVPFFPIINCVPYNVIDYLLLSGGCDLDERGDDFEKYIYKSITEVKHLYSIDCLPSKYYGNLNDGEEIDLIVVLKNLVIVVEAKCIHYSMEPQDYHNAWERLKEGAKQASRKATFVESHPELFEMEGALRKKRFLPVVVTNYPTFTGFDYNGVFIIDSHSFIAYLNSGDMVMKELSSSMSPIRSDILFYKTEDEYSSNFEFYLKNNPIKEIYMSKIDVENLELMPTINPWKCYGKSAVYRGDPGFDIQNESTSVNNS
ncbi:MAG: hypothetical protein IJM89_05850 [Bacteroidales bacterium]|nr:hypothetical protein [Bacteroidales bacterium]